MSLDAAEGKVGRPLTGVEQELMRLVGEVIRIARLIADRAADIELHAMQAENHIPRLLTGGGAPAEPDPQRVTARQATSLTLGRTDGDRFVARFAFGEVVQKMVLPRRLGELLAVLRTDNAQSDDKLIGWWSLEDLVRWLEKDKKASPGNAATMARKKHALAQLVYRLRNALRDAGIPRSLIETSPTRGIRLRLVRKQALLGASKPTVGGQPAADQSSDRV